KPRWLAVDGFHIYWTDPGDGGFGNGTIGRADLNGTNPNPACITGANNPQGIAVNAANVYWANDSGGGASSIGRAALDCSGVAQSFIPLSGTSPQGLALNATHLYWTENRASSNDSYLVRAPVDGSSSPSIFFVASFIQLRGIALDAGNLYWADQTAKTVGRIPIADFDGGTCSATPSCDRHLIQLDRGPSGVAVDAAHLYWSTEGQKGANPGNDLYRYDADSGELADLAPDSDPADVCPGTSTPCGAQIQGVIGTSDDGSTVYFVANGDLDGPSGATLGDCQRGTLNWSGQCNLYRWHDGSLTFIARLDANGGPQGDATDWLEEPHSLGLQGGQIRDGRVSADGSAVLFRSKRPLTAYDNQGTEQYYRWSTADGLSCVSCNPSGGPPAGDASLFTVPGRPLHNQPDSSFLSRNLSADGNRVFFESGALYGHGTAGVYEWEAPGSGSCHSQGQNGGCLYFLGAGSFADASASGDDAFIFTRDRLVAQDQDDLVDIYDARSGGGLASQQTPPPPGCTADACQGPGSPPPAEPGSGTSAFSGPGNQGTSRGGSATPPPATKHRKCRKHHKSCKKHKKRSRRATAGGSK
ncbi:MAG: hypothetical protein J2O47_02475, partial [Acidimicrobiaceae bacterium]|nr:hypothetical protein [Acidimicrobiaceae bacterium]